MSLIDKLGQGLPIAIIGYVMVFVVLAVLWGVVEIMHFAVTPKRKKTVVKEAQKPVEKTETEKYNTVYRVCRGPACDGGLRRR